MITTAKPYHAQAMINTAKPYYFCAPLPPLDLEKGAVAL
jgi:hypothetical protein